MELGKWEEVLPLSKRGHGVAPSDWNVDEGTREGRQRFPSLSTSDAHRRHQRDRWVVLLGEENAENA
jgi:hypothetical protein